MSQMLNLGKELLRISPKDSVRLEYSTNAGKSWLPRFNGAGIGEFKDLTDTGKEILGATAKGLYYSTNQGRSWLRRS